MWASVHAMMLCQSAACPECVRGEHDVGGIVLAMASMILVCSRLSLSRHSCLVQPKVYDDQAGIVNSQLAGALKTTD